MLSYTTRELGEGWVYAVNGALDEIGATIGPLLIALVLLLKGDYRVGYALLIIPALLALASLLSHASLGLRCRIALVVQEFSSCRVRITSASQGITNASQVQCTPNMRFAF